LDKDEKNSPGGVRTKKFSNSPLRLACDKDWPYRERFGGNQEESIKRCDHADDDDELLQLKPNQFCSNPINLVLAISVHTISATSTCISFAGESVTKSISPNNNKHRTHRTMVRILLLVATVATASAFGLSHWRVVKPRYATKCYASCGVGKEEGQDRRAFLFTSAFAAAAFVAPRQEVEAIGPIKIDLLNPRYSAKPCPKVS
jgi:hypothetical protein